MDVGQRSNSGLSDYVDANMETRLRYRRAFIKMKRKFNNKIVRSLGNNGVDSHEKPLSQTTPDPTDA